MLTYSCRSMAGTRCALTLRQRLNLQAALLHIKYGRVASRLLASKGVAGSDKLPVPTSPRSILTSHVSANLNLTDSQLLQARKYVKLVLEQNTTMNLTGAADEDEAFQMHIVDSLALLPVLDSIVQNQSTTTQQTTTQQCSIIDVGSGGGLPGVILAIARPDWKVTLVDCLRKRCAFVEKAVKDVGLQNTQVVWARAEEAGQCQQHREVYDVAVARAVAKMRVLAELCLPFVKPGGHWVAAKGPECEEEVAAAGNAIKILQGSNASIVSVNAFGSVGQHMAVVVEKLAATPPQYPRPPGKPNKRPL